LIRAVANTTSVRTHPNPPESRLLIEHGSTNDGSRDGEDEQITVRVCELDDGEGFHVADGDPVSPPRSASGFSSGAVRRGPAAPTSGWRSSARP